MSDEPKWEDVTREGRIETARMRVHGGWIYRVMGYGTMCALQFVPAQREPHREDHRA